LEQLLDVVDPAFLGPRRVVLAQCLQLAPGYLIALDGIGLGEIGLHILHKGLGHIHRQVKRLAGHQR
jgi:hypothetical protein